MQIHGCNKFCIENIAGNSLSFHIPYSSDTLLCSGAIAAPYMYPICIEECMVSAVKEAVRGWPGDPLQVRREPFKRAPGLGPRARRPTFHSLNVIYLPCLHYHFLFVLHASPLNLFLFTWSMIYTDCNSHSLGVKQKQNTL